MLEALSPALCSRTMKQLILIVEATLAMSGRVTIRGISRWTGKGGSERTVQRFFKEKHEWAELRWLLIKSHISEQCVGTWILIGDEVVVTKSGKKTHGLGRFFSSIQNQAVPGLCFINLSLLHVESRESYPLLAEQLLKNAPVLLWLIAIVSRDEEWTENQLIDCFASKRQIIIGRLGFKARRCALTVMNKLDISQYNENALTELKLWLSYDQLSELVHYPKINLEQLKLLRLCPFLMRSSFSFKRTAIAEIENIQQFSQILNDCIQMAEQLSQLAEVLHQLKKVASLTRFDEIHAQLTNKIQRKNCFNSRVNYSCPPLLGASEIVPITNSVDLYLEGEQQNHCIFSYHDDIVSGAYYVYQVLQPQRATLGLQINDGKPQLDQVFLHSNKSVSASTINRINFWLSQKEKLTKSICGQRIKVELLSGNKPKTSGIKGNREKTIKVKECKDSRNYNSDLKQRHMFEIEQSMAEYDVFIAELQN